MNIDSITNGVVIDHIEAGRAMELYERLGLAEIDCSVAIIKNVGRKKKRKKDIIKIDGETDINFDLIGYVDPEATVNIIKDGVLCEKKSIEMPAQLVNVLKCKNPRCITSTEQELRQVFNLTDKENKVYRCMYCESKAK